MFSFFTITIRSRRLGSRKNRYGAFHEYQARFWGNHRDRKGAYKRQAFFFTLSYVFHVRKPAFGQGS